MTPQFLLQRGHISFVLRNYSKKFSIFIFPNRDEENCKKEDCKKAEGKCMKAEGCKKDAEHKCKKAEGKCMKAEGCKKDAEHKCKKNDFSSFPAGI